MDVIKKCDPLLIKSVNIFDVYQDENALEMFEVPNTGESVEKKELEMFEQSNSEEDFEIPAFLRRQKN